MKIKLTKDRCIVTREKTDPKFYGIKDAKGESNLLYCIKTELNKQGFDFIKKRMWKDGHLVNDMQQYIRERKNIKTIDGPRCLAIFNNNWAIEGAEVSFNKDEVILNMVNLAKSST